MALNALLPTPWIPYVTVLNKGYITAWIIAGILISSNLNGCFIQFEGEYVFSNLYTVSTLVNK